MKINKEQLKELINQGESYNLEFKEGYNKDIGREICAFANANGGKILIGINDDGMVKGLNISNKTKSTFQDISSKIEPAINIDIYPIENIMIIDVPEGIQKPYSINGKFYLRTGPNTQQLKRDEVRDFFQKERRVFFDELVNDKFSVKNDIDENAFNKFKNFANISDVLEKKDILDNLDLIEKNYLKNAGVLLFCKRITRYIRTATITCVLYQGYDKYKILDRKEYDADLYNNFLDALNYLKAKLNTEYIIKGGPREERLELPEEALREAILNALAHRDYYSTGNIQISIYNDRVEIDNPGGLIGKQKVEDLFGRSLPRNPLLFGLMQRMNLVEKIGSGLMRIKNVIKEYGLSETEFETDNNWFKIVFKRSLSKDDTYTKNKEDPRRETKERIIEIIKEKPDITTNELVKITGLSQRGVEWNINKLKTEKRIKRVGSKKSGYWELILK